jgi:hypothetical protein
MAALAGAHARTVARFPRPYFDGAVLTWADLAAGPDGCPDVPCAQESRFTPAAADRGRIRTPCAYTAGNLSTYWRPWWRRNRQLRPLPLAMGLSAWFPVWAVLGVSRLPNTHR